MRFAISALTASALVLPLTQCGIVDADDPACPLIAEVGIRAVVRDSVTGVAAAQGATGTALDGEFVSELRGSDLYLVGADERPGTYTVRVEKPGYHSWERSGIVVNSDPCGVLTTEIDVLLRPVEP